jgi:predicted hotdog family 3-hydroxylacyl-ACP dehydratase
MMNVIGREQILMMVPHAGTMCLLDGVLHWDAVSMRCFSRRFQQPDNPMRRGDGTLGTACGIEVAAQAMAVHGRLLTRTCGSSTQGYLASVRDVWFAVHCFDLASDELLIDVERIGGDALGATYRFTVTSGAVELLGGRATVVFGAQ